jgi:hypothetical protein
MLGCHSGWLRVSFVDRKIGAGDVVRCVYVEPSDSVISCVKVYGRCGRRSREAWRTWAVAVALEVSGERLARRRVWDGREAIVGVGCLIRLSVVVVVVVVVMLLL